MLFLGFGLLLGRLGLEWFEIEIELTALHFLAELTLVVILFHDAARIPLRALRREHTLPVRMLLVGMPLMIVLGAIMASWLPLGLSFWEACLLATLLSPTDAALGLPVVESKALPVRMRQAVNVESGLNDGIALPLVLVFASLATTGDERTATEWAWFVTRQLSLGPLVGVLIGGMGGWIICRLYTHGWMGERAEGIAVLSIAALSFSVADSVGGNGFISAFSAGLMFGHFLKRPAPFVFKFAETEGQLLTLSIFFLLGAVLLASQISNITPWVVLYALLSLVLIRMLAIGISLLGTGLHGWSYVFLGWFGPRGLATLIFVVLVQQDKAFEHSSTVGATALLTVVFSIVLHGLTAAPGVRLYARFLDSSEHKAERQAVPEVPTRKGEFSRVES
ncbi:cation:proton antiporter [Allohahella marinimesophila]|uniref:Cation:proton antiporter n=2 Tax=Allohahella marinimesophila TaxID=1054972 RepID=A0ABP7NHR5_9GAMM